MMMFLGVALIAGIVQGVTGFGAGIIMMMLLPMLYPLTQSAGISVCVSIVLLLSMVYTYHRYINFRLIILPSISFLLIATITINLSTSFDASLMKKIFGVFLLILSIYYLFFQKDHKQKMNIWLSLFCIITSAICDGLFGIGGPLMVLYFMSVTDHTFEYLGTIQCFFLINCLYTTSLRIMNGILLYEHIPMIILGMIGIALGGQIAKKIASRIDANMIRKLTYLMIGLCGLMNVL